MPLSLDLSQEQPPGNKSMSFSSLFTWYSFPLHCFCFFTFLLFCENILSREQELSMSFFLFLYLFPLLCFSFTLLCFAKIFRVRNYLLLGFPFFLLNPGFGYLDQEDAFKMYFTVEDVFPGKSHNRRSGQ